jgi:sugar phosphate isomerase/epimerase
VSDIGFHTDAFNSSYWNFEQCLAWAQENGLRYIECGAIDGVSWIHGLGYQPHIALWEDPLLLRRKMDRYCVSFSQIDAAFPLSLPEGATLGVEYVLHTIRYAKLVGCPRVDTTDARNQPEGMTDREALDHMRRIYRQILPVAEAYEITINVEPHGYYTTRPEFLGELLGFSDSPFLRLNMDTGNTFIAGQDPVAFLTSFSERSAMSTSRTSVPAWRPPRAGNLPELPSVIARSETGSMPRTSAVAWNAWWAPGSTVSSASNVKDRAAR